MRELLLGIDAGTSFCKAAVFDTDLRELANGRARTPWTRVPTGAEIDPQALVGAVLAAATQAIAEAPDGRVLAIGVAGMAETGVLLDAGGAPVTPAIAWHDSRGAAEAAEMASVFGAEGFAARTGLPPSPLCSLSKLRWQRSCVPAAGAAVRWLGVPEWVARCLGAADVAELSLASRTGLLDLAGRRWWDDALAWLGVPDGFMAEPVAAGVPVGRAGDALPEAHGAHITIAGHDHLTAAVGAGTGADGDVLHSSGTAEVFVRTIAEGLPAERVAAAVGTGVTVGWHVLPHRWAVVSGGELSVAPARVLQMLGIEGDDQREALSVAAAALTDDDGMWLEPGSDGGALTLHGIGPEASPAHVWRAALEAGAEASAGLLARIDAVVGTPERIVVVGGGARGPAARAAKERRLGAVEWSPVREATARGAVVLAGVAAGIYGSADDAPPPERTAASPRPG